MTYATQRTWYDHQPRPHDPSKYGRSPGIAKHLSTPEAFHVVTQLRENNRPLPAGTAPVGIGLGHAHELYRMRTMSHLYDERDVEVLIDLERIRARSTGHLLADCHRCKTTAQVTPDADACPTCGTEYE
jgi:hypothetical protein